MTTATEVLEAIDRRIVVLEQEAAGPCIEALLGDVDRETYRDAVRRGAALKAVKTLRKQLEEEVEIDAAAPKTGKRK
jgi:hypothetical protein